MKSLILMIALGQSLSANASMPNTMPNKLKVFEVNGNAGTVVGIRLNQNVNKLQNPLALNAEFNCNYRDAEHKIVLCKDGACNASNRVFHDFAEPTSCFEAQKKLKIMVKATGSACLFLTKKNSPYGGIYSVLSVLEAKYCD